jgi:hypothetical protein
MTFPLLLISAWNDSGGAFLHRLFDGHPECFVYPFELQLGTSSLRDGYADWFHAKYRWPALPTDLDVLDSDDLFGRFIDDEVKSYLRARSASKFRDFELDLSLPQWQAEFRKLLPVTGRSHDATVGAYVGSLFRAWRNRRRSGREHLHVGHCPIVIIDADRILTDCPEARVIHVVRQPTSGFADFVRRVPGMDIGTYCRKWAVVNLVGFHFAQKYPERVMTVRFDRLLGDRARTMPMICAWVGLEYDHTLEAPTWNGEPLGRLSPFGGVPRATIEHEQECERSLSHEERDFLEAETRTVMRLYP